MAEQMKLDTVGLEPALKYVGQLAEQAVGAKGKVDIVPIPGDPLKRMLVTGSDGKHEVYEPAAEPRHTELGSITEVAKYVAFVQTDVVQPSVYYGAEQVFVITDDSAESRRLDHANVKLHRTPQFEKLVSLDTVPNTFKQKDFIRLFNRDLRDCIPPDELKALLKALRAIDFENTVKGTATSERGRESMGREITDEIRSKAGPIPEEILLVCEVFTERAVHCEARIRCLIDMDPRALCFSLEPLAGQIDDAILDAVEAVGGVLRADIKEACPVFFGSP